MLKSLSALKFTKASLLNAVLIVLYLAYFVYSTRETYSFWFSRDDLMNLHYYWRYTWSDLLLSNLLVFTDYYRPVGGIFYLPVYTLFGLDSIPFHTVLIVVVCADLVLLHALANTICKNHIAAMLPLLLVGLHGSLFSLYFNTAMIYDALCCFFYFTALLIYIRIRESNRFPTIRQSVGILTLYIFSLNSKEMAISLPFGFVLYELLNKRHKYVLLFRYLFRELSLVGISIILTAGYCLSRTLLSDAIGRHPDYQTVISVDRFQNNLAHYIKLFFYLPDGIGTQAVLSGVALFLFCAVLIGVKSKNKFIFWSMLMVFISFLPIAFIDPRNGFAFFISSVWLAITLSLMVSELFRLASGLLSKHKEQAYYLLLTAFALSLLLFLQPIHKRYLQYSIDYTREHAVLEKNYRSIKALLPNVHSHTKILVLNDSLPKDTFEMFFLLRLMYEDNSLEVDRVRQINGAPFSHPADYYNCFIDYNAATGEYSVRLT